MKTGIVITLAGVFALDALAAGAVTNGVSPSARQTILSSYTGIDAAYRQKNVDRLFSYFTPNYVVYQGGVAYSVAMNRQSQAQLFAEADAVASTTLVQRMTTHGRGVVAIITQYITEMRDNVQEGRTDKYSYVIEEQDFWVKTPLGWRIQNTQVLSETDTANGKPVGNDRSTNSPDRA